MTTARLLVDWSFDPFVCASCLLAFITYVSRYKLAARQAGFLVAAVSVLCVALLSPIAALANGVLFSAHMLQHLLLILIVPALALLALPRSDAAASSGRVNAAFRWWPSWLLGVGAMWLWHAPALCNAATTNPTVHEAQTLSLLAMGGAFWWPILAPRSATRIAPLAGVLYLFSACTACTALGILVTFSPVAVCSAYTHPSDALGLLSLVRDQWGITCAADQRIGGLLMWVPACLIYGCAILGSLAQWYRSDNEVSPADRASGSQAAA